MGKVDLNFKPDVPVFDANVALGRRNDRRVPSHTVDGLQEAMDRDGVGRALVYAPHAVSYDSEQGNQMVLDMIEGHDNLTAQYACNPVFDDFDDFTAQVENSTGGSIRLVPSLHGYGFRDWAIKPWLDWAEAKSISVWLPLGYDFIGRHYETDPRQIHDTVKAHPKLNLVLSEVHYSHVAWAYPLLETLPNLHIEISRLMSTDGVPMLMDLIGEDRILYGSRFPDAAMGPQLHHVHRSGLSQTALEKICAGNAERLLGLN